MKELIDEMSYDLAECHVDYLDDAKLWTDYDTMAQKMVSRGYRKQSDGEWVEASNNPHLACGKKCSLCGARITYREYNHGNHKYCHKCGAKMKG